ncbi:putative fatty acyl-CoA reductase CG8306 [Lucilia sericata]|uniref:putative fatty acyl-CoA reductase CG8306 n=1 Tax=Lucilia sericata TaxID=13632 RepID=UPI0018A84213|nr:putative fatty acyl-CoA reductase CG8306 [Lucilia sericata]XP_037813456.1 putative fatty acyl-CoA reductase CG8306 [Lucilia sericata]XP_037813457.1 putative fatty acyl-CoA reductase CG8306 [Lucilia sericata]
MLITDFYADREVFITGGTGFLGKALIEKLLRDCPKIKVIYILLRGKRSVGVEQRLEEFKKNKVFDRINRECPEVLDKLHAIQGDSQELGLAIAAKDLELLKNVSIIFHMAANVKFDDPLRSSILLNTRGTWELLKIAEKLKHLLAFIHCSTAYCNPFEKVVEERVYKIPVDWRKAIKIAETYDEYTINALCAKYSGYCPNTYTFTKNLSEQIIQEYSSKLPISILRPSIVINALKEPVPGWIDNMNGPLGAMVGLSVGILPMSYCNANMEMDCIPVDVVTKLTVVAGYKLGLQTLRKEPKVLEVINCASGEFFSINMHRASILYNKSIEDNPMENCIWYFGSPWLTSCYYNFVFHIFLMNLPLALLIDTALRLVGHQPLMIKISRRIMYTMKAIGFFSMTEYKIINKNMIELDKYIPESEFETYNVIKDIKEVDFSEFFDNAVRGAKYNFFDQPTVATDGSRKRFKIFIIVNKSIKLLVFALVLNYLWLIASKL